MSTAAQAQWKSSKPKNFSLEPTLKQSSVGGKLMLLILGRHNSLSAAGGRVRWWVEAVVDMRDTLVKKYCIMKIIQPRSSVRWLIVDRRFRPTLVIHLLKVDWKHFKPWKRSRWSHCRFFLFSIESRHLAVCECIICKQIRNLFIFLKVQLSCWNGVQTVCFISDQPAEIERRAKKRRNWSSSSRSSTNSSTLTQPAGSRRHLAIHQFSPLSWSMKPRRTNRMTTNKLQMMMTIEHNLMNRKWNFYTIFRIFPSFFFIHRDNSTLNVTFSYPIDYSFIHHG